MTTPTSELNPRTATAGRWDPQRARYRSANGRLVSEAAIARELERVILRQQAEFQALGRQYQAGEITLDQLRLEMRAAVKDLHLYSAALARGGWDQMDSVALGQVGGRLRVHYAYLDRFMQAIATGQVRGSIATRAGTYAQAARGTYNRAKAGEASSAGRLLRNILNPLAEHCDECVRITNRGPIPADEMPPVGSRECGMGCKCRIEVVGGMGGPARPEPEPQPPTAGPAIERREEERIEPTFSPGDRVRTRHTTGTVLAQDEDGRFVIRSDASGRTTRVQPGSVRPLGEPTVTPPPPAEPEAPPPGAAPTPTPARTEPFIEAGQIRAPIGAFVVADTDPRTPAGRGQLSGIFVGYDPQTGQARVRTEDGARFEFAPSQLTIAPDPRLSSINLPPRDAPAPATVLEAIERGEAIGVEIWDEPRHIPDVGGGVEYSAQRQGRRFEGFRRGEKIIQAQQLTLSIERLKRLYPGLQIRGPAILVDTGTGKAVTPAKVQELAGAALEDVMTPFNTTNPMTPREIEVDKGYELKNPGQRWAVGGSSEWDTSATRHEIAHTQTTLRARDAWRRIIRDAGAFTTGPTGERLFNFKRRVSGYSASDEEYEQIAEVAAMVSAPNYVPGTLPAEMEEFVVRLYNGEFWVE